MDILRTTLNEFGLWSDVGKVLKNVIFDEILDEYTVSYVLGLPGTPKENIHIQLIDNVIKVIANDRVYQTRIYHFVHPTPTINYSNGELKIMFPRLRINQTFNI